MKKYNVIIVYNKEENKILMCKREKEPYKGKYNLVGGKVENYEDSSIAAYRELYEETGITQNDIELKSLMNFQYIISNIELEVYVGKLNKEVTLVEEVNKLYWIDSNSNFFDGEIYAGEGNIGHMINRVEMNREKLFNTYSYIGKKVKVKIDRELGSKHPKHGFIYEVNYGYVPNTISGDGEEIDCYVLGIDEPIEEFEGQCIAIIHRTNDDDDKLIIVPEGKEYSDDEIRKLTNFQEQYFKSKIIR